VHDDHSDTVRLAVVRTEHPDDVHLSQWPVVEVVDDRPHEQGATVRPQPARTPGTRLEALRAQRCPLCNILTSSPAADLRPNRRHPPDQGEPFVCGYCGYVAQFTGQGMEIIEAPPQLLAQVRDTTTHRTLIAALRKRHHGNEKAGPATTNGVFERTVYTQPVPDLSDRKET
jgi:hypothetical protein